MNLKKAKRLNLLICGAMRSGTTSLKHYLNEHPEVGFIEGGDIVVHDQFTGYYPFASPSFSQSQLGEDEKLYERFSSNLSGKMTYIADKRAYFIFFPQIPFNLREQLPDVKLIFILRNPVEIVYSAFCQEKGEKQSTQTFEQYLRESSAQIKEVSSSFNRDDWLNYFHPGSGLPVLIERGFYYNQIIRFYNLFSEEQILVLRFDRLKEKPGEVMKEVLRFLKLPENFNFSNLGRIYNACPANPPMDSKIKAHLQGLYAESNRKLLTFLRWPVSLWEG